MTLSTLLRRLGREVAAVLVESYISSATGKTREGSEVVPSPCDVGVVSPHYRIPEKLKLKLSLLLDPVDPVSRHGWRHLASNLGLDDKINYIRSRGNPTHQLLVVCESRRVDMLTLAAMVRSMGREDAAKVIEQYDGQDGPEMARQRVNTSQGVEDLWDPETTTQKQCASISLPVSMATNARW